MPELRIYSDMEHYLKYREIDEQKKTEINKKAQELIYSELDKLPNRPGKR